MVKNGVSFNKIAIFLGVFDNIDIYSTIIEVLRKGVYDVRDISTCVLGGKCLRWFW